MPINTTDLIAGLVVTVILGLAIFYIVKAKKSGEKCIGCPHSKTCSKCCGCGDKKKTSK